LYHVYGTIRGHQTARSEVHTEAKDPKNKTANTFNGLIYLKNAITGRVTMQGLEKIWKVKHVSLQTKTRIVNTMIIPVILYGCVTWTKTRAMEKKIDECEMWIWRRMTKVSWTEKRTNESILMKIGHARGDICL